MLRINYAQITQILRKYCCKLRKKAQITDAKNAWITHKWRNLRKYYAQLHKKYANITHKLLTNHAQITHKSRKIVVQIKHKLLKKYAKLR